MNMTQKKKGKSTKILIAIIILIVMSVLGRYFWHQRNPEPMQIQFVDISMNIPGNMTQVTGSDYKEIFDVMAADADTETAYIQDSDSYGNTEKFYYALQYSDSSDVNVDELIKRMEAATDISYDVKNYYIEDIDARIIEHSGFPEPIENFIERSAIFVKNDSLYIISYIMEKTEDESNFYKSIDTIR